MNRLFDFLLGAAVGAALMGLALARPVRSAPAPFPRPRDLRPAPLDLRGCWRLHWGGCAYTILLHADGSYSATAPNSDDWTGTWSLVGRTLRVREQAAGSGIWVEWCVELDADLAGATTGGTRVALRRP